MKGNNGDEVQGATRGLILDFFFNRLFWLLGDEETKERVERKRRSEKPIRRHLLKTELKFLEKGLLFGLFIVTK